MGLPFVGNGHLVASVGNSLLVASIDNIGAAQGEAFTGITKAIQEGAFASNIEEALSKGILAILKSVHCLEGRPVVYHLPHCFCFMVISLPYL